MPRQVKTLNKTKKKRNGYEHICKDLFEYIPLFLGFENKYNPTSPCGRAEHSYTLPSFPSGKGFPLKGGTALKCPPLSVFLFFSFRAKYVTDYKCVVEKSQDGGFSLLDVAPGCDL